MNTWKITNYDHFLHNILKYTEEEVEDALSKEKKEIYYRDYFEIKKKNGKRKIYAVNSGSALYKLQKNLANNFLNNIIIADDVYGFVKGYGYVDYLRRHQSFSGDRKYIRLDIEDFFGSIDSKLVGEVLDYYIEKEKVLTKEERGKILKYLIEIVLYEDRVIQGAVTSPVISNIIFRQLDIRIQKYCNELDITYTRYVDDMLFSSYNSKVHSKFFLQRIAEIIRSKGFSLNYSKTIRTQKEISLNGYVVGNNLRISRKKLKDITRVLFILDSLDIKKEESYLEKLNNQLKDLNGNEESSFYNHHQLINYLAGQRAFIISVLKNTEYVECNKEQPVRNAEFIDFSKSANRSVENIENSKFRKKAKKLIERIEINILNIYENQKTRWEIVNDFLN